MRRATSTIIIAGLVLAFCLAGCGKKTETANAQQQQTQNSGLPEGIMPVDQAQDAPIWTMQNLKGADVTLADFKGKVVVLDFWDTWCPPCRAEIPGFIELQDEYKDKGVVFVGAALGREGPDKVASFAENQGMNYPVVLATAEVVNMYGPITGIPTKFIIDRDGKVRARFVGGMPKAAMEEKIKALL